MNIFASNKKFAVKKRRAPRALRALTIVSAIVCSGTLFTFADSSQGLTGTGALAAPLQVVSGQSSTLLPDGQWLLLGGKGGLRDQGLLVRASGTSPVPARLIHPRSDHSATLLPDGRVLVLGGVDASGALVGDAETFDSVAQQFTEEPIEGLLSRAHHSATVLGDGRVLITGGVGERGQVVTDVELWDATSGDIERFDAGLALGRQRHTATLLSGGSVLLSGGVAAEDTPLDAAEIFDPDTGRVRRVTAAEARELVQKLDGAQAPAVESSTPMAEATGVSGEDPLIIRFNKHMSTESLHSHSITLVGPSGTEPVQVVPVEQGTMMFVWPRKEMMPASRYTLFMRGMTDNAQRTLPLTAIAFDTAAKPADSGGLPVGVTQPDMPRDAQRPELDTQRSRLSPFEQAILMLADSTADSEDWLPGLEHFHGRWLAERADSPLQALPPLEAPAGVTALSTGPRKLVDITRRS